MMDRLKEVIRKANSLDLESLNAAKNLMFFMVVADLFGVYWWLGAKRIAVAFLLVIIVMLGMVLSLEKEKLSKQPKKGVKKLKKKSEKVEETEEEEDEEEYEEEVEEKPKSEGMFGNIGLPDPDEYSKRMEKALGSGI